MADELSEHPWPAAGPPNAVLAERLTALKDAVAAGFVNLERVINDQNSNLAAQIVAGDNAVRQEVKFVADSAMRAHVRLDQQEKEREAQHHFNVTIAVMLFGALLTCAVSLFVALH